MKSRRECGSIMRMWNRDMIGLLARLRRRGSIQHWSRRWRTDIRRGVKSEGIRVGEYVTSYEILFQIACDIWDVYGRGSEDPRVPNLVGNFHSLVHGDGIAFCFRNCLAFCVSPELACVAPCYSTRDLMLDMPTLYIAQNGDICH